ncbi:Hypothetical protein A7982_07978 [Minicystis rosea]|nr:Hypothetical protein A7982_07978 [Minicystis rosea]
MRNKNQSNKIAKQQKTKKKTKSYVIPIDKDGCAYLGIRSLMSPYKKERQWCGGMPSIIGGNNDKRDSLETIVVEAEEESHRKVVIKKDAEITEVHKDDGKWGDLTFFTTKDFEYKPNAQILEGEIQKQSFGENTGQVIKLDLSKLPESRKEILGVLSEEMVKQGIVKNVKDLNATSMSELLDEEGGFFDALKKAATCMKKEKKLE